MQSGEDIILNPAVLLGIRAIRPLTGLNDWRSLSLRLAISWSVMPLNTLFRHLFCVPGVMYGMLRGYAAERGNRYGREAEDTAASDLNPGWTEGTSLAQLATLSGRVISLCCRPATFSLPWATILGSPFKIKASHDKSPLVKTLYKGLKLTRPSIINPRYSNVPQLQWCKFESVECSFLKEDDQFWQCDRPFRQCEVESNPGPYSTVLTTPPASP